MEQFKNEDTKLDPKAKGKKKKKKTPKIGAKGYMTNMASSLVA